MRGAFLTWKKTRLAPDEGSLFDLEKKENFPMRGAFFKLSTSNHVFPNPNPRNDIFGGPGEEDTCSRHAPDEGSLFEKSR